MLVDFQKYFSLDASGTFCRYSYWSKLKQLSVAGLAAWPVGLIRSTGSRLVEIKQGVDPCLVHYCFIQETSIGRIFWSSPQIETALTGPARPSSREDDLHGTQPAAPCQRRGQRKGYDIHPPIWYIERLQSPGCIKTTPFPEPVSSDWKTSFSTQWGESCHFAVEAGWGFWQLGDSGCVLVTPALLGDHALQT